MTDLGRRQVGNFTQGPHWQNELLERISRNKNNYNKLGCVNSWGAIPYGISLASICHESVDRASLGYFTSSTTGSPKRVLFTSRDWQDAAVHRASCLASLGVGSDSFAAVVLPFGPWFSGDNLSDALLRLGASVLPVGLYEPHLPGAIRLMDNVGVNVLITTPSVAMILTRFSSPSNIKKIILVGEAVSNNLRAQLAAHFGVVPQCLFAASESVLGAESPDEPSIFVWDPDLLHLEVLTEEKEVREYGIGELLVTRRYGEAMPLLRYRLGDRVELLPADSGMPKFIYLGRIGHAFSLVSGVKVGRAQLDQYLDDLATPVHLAEFTIGHTQDGDHLHIRLGGTGLLHTPDQIRNSFIASSLDLSDAYNCGFVQVTAETCEVPVRAKRYLRITETPWSL